MWSFHFGEELYAVTIKNDSLVAAPLFSTAEGLKSEWDVKYRYSEGYADYERVILDKAIYMDWENKQIYIPQVESKEEEYSTEEYFVTGRYDCYYFNGEVFEMASTRSKQDLADAISFYDYIEILPLDICEYFVERGRVDTKEELSKILRRIVDVAKEQNKLIVATGDVHYIDQKKKKKRV